MIKAKYVPDTILRALLEIIQIAFKPTVTRDGVNHISHFKCWKTTLSHDSVQEVLGSHLRWNICLDWGFCGFAQSHSTNTGKMRQIRPRPLTSTFFATYCLLIDPPLDIKDFELPIASLSLTHSWNWALLEKPPLVHLLKNFPTFYGTRRFISMFTRAVHLSLSWVRSIQSIPSYLS
jgi:hypothetical protein